ncbi:AfsR/SARP family transcriptional regulator [Streptomyces antibioticus]|uniref:AfsR/SARP family transcriptional regulator n=1 Tax=Streptomyces antibioticus TaxID=1890 RepID=UPI00224E7246|nr:BTAD domain-containing putative transcriptional regulator [Streptomyces antibioticus]MCX4739550.1 winged helix-turn-helix domain-containing protein [Streptomyces antibioticus]
MDPVRYRILGTTQALRPDGTPVAVGGARLRALLTVLALRAGRTVPAGTLVDEVWAGDPPADATGALQALVGRLRRALGPDAVDSTAGGYRLTAAPDAVDLHRFERLTADGLRALADGDPAKAAGLLDDALALWQGPALADLPDRAAEAARHETRRLDAVRARHTAALALGHAAQSLPELTALCDAHPLDEPLQTLRLRALRDTGRPAEALAAYDEVRRLLADRLGSDPGPALRALHAELLSPEEPPPADTNAETDTGLTESAAAVAVRADAPSGERTPDPAADPRVPSAPAPDATPTPGNLRARLTSFVGREADIEVIQGDLAGARLVTLLGPGGAGKTRLSQEVGEAVRRHLRDGVWLAELAPVSDPDAVPQAVLTAVGARETVLYGAGAEEMRAVAERHDDPVERLVEHCARRRMLIVLDNCEHVIEAAARLVARLLERCPGLVVLATSREPLGVPGELVRPVEPLPEPVALRLLADRGAAARPGFRTEDDPEACAEICRRLDGLPLAIELAAARLRILTPRQIADRLDDRFRLLTSGSRTVLPRQQTLRAVVDWSWDLLDEDERDVLARLSVFARGCDLAAVEAVCGGGDALDPLSSLASLVDKSLVVAAPAADGAMRYRLLETVAEYAAERLDERGHRLAAERAHLTYYRELARTIEPLLRGSRQLEAIERFQAEYENLRTALRRAVDARDEQEALVLALSLVGYWQMRDLRIEARNWSRAVMELGPDPFTDPVRPAAPVLEPVIATPPPLTGEVLLEARRGIHLSHLACMDMELDAWDNPAAQNKLRVVGETYAPGLPQTCRAPGLLWFYAVMLTGDMDRIRVIVDANVETCRATPGYEHELATCLQMRANLLANRSDWAGDAGRDADEALEIFGRLGDSWGAAEAYSARAEASERLGAYREAAVDYQAAMDHAEQLGARHQLAVLGARLGSALVEAGDTERGERILRDVIDSRWGMANEAMPVARLFLAGWLGLTGRRAEAREQLLLLREEFGIAHFVVFDAFILGAEAWLDVLDGRYESALAAVRKALERAADKLSMNIAPHMRAFYLVIAAAALAGADGGRRAVDAARCLGTADTLLPPHHVAVRLEREAHRLATERARTALGDPAFDAAYAEGGGLSYEEATALV